MGKANKQAEESSNLDYEKRVASLNAFLIRFDRMTVPQATDLRRRIRSAGGTYEVVKNRLALRAIEGKDLGAIQDKFTGPAAVAYSQDDPVSLARALTEFRKDVPAIEFTGVLVDGQVVSKNEVESIASMPLREHLIVRLLAVLQQPQLQLIRVLGRIAEAKSVSGHSFEGPEVIVQYKPPTFRPLSEDQSNRFFDYASEKLAAESWLLERPASRVFELSLELACLEYPQECNSHVPKTCVSQWDPRPSLSFRIDDPQRILCTPTPPQPEETALLVHYPSGALRSVSGYLSGGPPTSLNIRDPFALFDPESDEAPVVGGEFKLEILAI